MKKIIVFLLIICMIIPHTVIAEDTSEPKIYIFGDDWAYEWGKNLAQFAYDPTIVINAAGEGELLSLISKKKEYQSIKKDDVVILSYGILEKDRPGDKNADFKKALEDVVKYLENKGAIVVFASICSTMRYNTVTGQLAETKNFYTETTRSFAKQNGIVYIDLANITAAWASKLGSEGAAKIYKSTLALSDNANRYCAYEVFKELVEIEQLKGNLKNNLSQVYIIGNETSKVFDVFFEDTLCDSYTVYIKNGNNVTVNNIEAENGDCTLVAYSTNGKINVKFSSCEKIQVTPNYRFDADGVSTTDKPFEGYIPPGVYDVSVKKTEPLRGCVYLNSYRIASHLDMPGTQEVLECSEHTFKEYHLIDNKFSVEITGLTDKLDYISFREPSVIFDERPRIFVGGDSTVCNYYPLKRTGDEADGTVMTGWAMLLEKYVDVDVTNLAASGDWASKWLEETFPIVEKEGNPGDIFVVQFGINDKSKSSIQEMKSALSEMIDRCASKGIIPILVSPQISAYGWGLDENMTNISKSDGGAYEEFFSAVRTLSEEKGCFYVDLTDLSAGWFSEMGRDNVLKKYHLWDYEKNEPKDMMHLSYKGADAMCRFFVMGLKNISTSEKKDNWGNSLGMLKFW